MTAVITPPIGGALFVISDYTGLTVGEVARGAFPFLVAIIIAWLIVMFNPETVLFLPHLIWK
jgi:C4-dicarboxylate transporter DctM subunit